MLNSLQLRFNSNHSLDYYKLADDLGYTDYQLDNIICRTVFDHLNFDRLSNSIKLEKTRK